MKDTYLTLNLQYKHSGTFANRKHEELSYPKKSENVRPHSSNSSENATPIKKCQFKNVFVEKIKRNTLIDQNPFSDHNSVADPDQDEARNAEKCFFETGPLLSQGPDDPGPPLT